MRFKRILQSFFGLVLFVSIGSGLFLLGYEIGKTPAVEFNPENLSNICLKIFMGEKFPDKITEVTGDIEKVGKDYLIIKVEKTSSIPVPSLNILLEDKIKVLIDKDTEILKHILKSKEEYEKEREQIMKLPPQEREKMGPLSTYYTEKIDSISEITPGLRVLAKSKGEDLRKKTQFVAERIEVWFPSVK
jgi:hypothetical protein